MQIVLFNNKQSQKLYPFTETRAVADLRVGMFTNAERWQLYCKLPVQILTDAYMQDYYNPMPVGNLLLVDASIIPNTDLINTILALEVGSYLSYEKGFIAAHIFAENPISLNQVFNLEFPTIHHWQKPILRIDDITDILLLNNTLIESDFKLYTKGKQSQNLHESNTVIAPSNVFIEEGANITCSVLNASSGFIYIGKNATIMEGSFIRGPFVLGENSLVKMGAKIYGSTTVGHHCVVGGEIKNSLIMANSNKAHDGYLGDSVIGEWCNLGACTTNSNVKNTGSTVKLYNKPLNKYFDAGQKAGVFMGSYTRTAINSSINTGSVFGSCCNVFGAGLLPKHINSFTFGTQEKYILHKAFVEIDNWKKMKHQRITDAEKDLLTFLYNN